MTADEKLRRAQNDQTMRREGLAARSEPRAEGLEPFWNRRWALFEDEDSRFCVVTDDEAAEYVVWPEMGESDVRRIVDAHNTLLNAARMPEDAATPPAEGLDVLRELASWELHGVGGVDPDGYVMVRRDELDALRAIRRRARVLAPEQPE